jgi:hypothetical protein
MVGHIIKHSVESKAVYGAEKHIPKGWEHKAEELANSAISGFPLYGLPVWIPVLVGIVLLAAFVGWLLVGKGFGSHAGREEIRRSYRRQLAREMAKEDAAKIRAGEKPRRWWYQW